MCRSGDFNELEQLQWDFNPGVIRQCGRRKELHQLLPDKILHLLHLITELAPPFICNWTERIIIQKIHLILNILFIGLIDYIYA